MNAPAKLKPLIFVLLDTPAEQLGLNLTDKAVLQSLAGHLNTKRNGTEVWPSNERLAALTGGSVKTVRRAKHRLHQAQLIKIRRDSGKSDMCTINAELIRNLTDPSQIGRGKAVDPSQNGRGTPPKLALDPSQIGTRTAKGTTKLNSQDLTVGCSSTSKVLEDPRQRKLAVHGIVAGAAKRMRIDNAEQPTIKKQDEPRVQVSAKGGDP